MRTRLRGATRRVRTRLGGPTRRVNTGPGGPAREALRPDRGGGFSEQRQLPGELGHDVPVQRGLRGPELRLSPRPGTRHEFPVLPRAGRIVPCETTGDDGDLTTALGAASTARGHGISVPRARPRNAKTPPLYVSADRRGFPSVAAPGFEPGKVEPADLQSAPFGRSGTPPGLLPFEPLFGGAPWQRRKQYPMWRGASPPD